MRKFLIAAALAGSVAPAMAETPDYIRGVGNLIIMEEICGLTVDPAIKLRMMMEAMNATGQSAEVVTNRGAVDAIGQLATTDEAQQKSFCAYMKIKNERE